METPNYERRYGSKYDSKLNTTQIAKAFRADVKAAQKSGDLPKRLKLSVRTQYYAGGSSIRVGIKDMPCGARSTRAAVIANRLEDMLKAYNHNGSDSRFDHFDVNFYGSVQIDCNFGSDEEEQIDWQVARDEAAAAPPAEPAPVATSAHEGFLAMIGAA